MLVELYKKMFPGEPVPVDISVHPTPLYESISSFLLLIVLLLPIWKTSSGRRFAFFLVWFGISRFLVENIRLNPFIYWGLSSSQLLSVFFVALGLIMFLRASYIDRKNKKA
jgi:phosphatidylglycerol:prolipoprotein diacylglycerol transferase